MSRADWDVYFMNIAKQVATRATCNRKLVGAVITRELSILATGYNGSIRGAPHCDDVDHLMEDGHCVVGSTVISKYQTGYYNTGHRTVASIFGGWQNPVHRSALRRMNVRAMTPTGLIVPAHISDVWEAGAKPTVKVRTYLGREISVTEDQKFYTRDGWKSAQDLEGQDVALNGQPAAIDIEWMANRYVDGATILELADVVGRSRGFVKRRLVKAGIELRPFKLGGWNKGFRREESHSYRGRAVASASTARSRARRYALEETCKVCGGFDDLQVHHKDGDHLNDADRNLATLCVTCHSVAHTPHAKTETIVFDRVVSVTQAKVEMTYDLTVDGFHNYVGDGFVVHNCVRTVHAEVNAVAQAARNGTRIDGSTLYVTASPCWSCFKLMANAGIVRIVFGEFYRDAKIWEAAQQAGIRLEELKS